MSNPFDNVKDSSIWFKPTSLSTINTLDTRLYVGIVREAFNDAKTKELRYMVEIHHKNDTILSNCRMLRRWGGAYNYEDYIMHGYNHNAASNNQNGVAAVPGDVVLVGQFAGQGREGVIIGALTHVARKSFLDIKKGPQYKSEFNGIETSINEDGEWTQTFKGQPTNKDKLDAAPSEPVPAPEYDKDVGTSFMKWDKTGSYTLSDEATDGDKIQKLFIDKKNGTIDIFSGKINLNFKKEGQKVSLKCKETLVTSDDKITYKTKNFEGEATDHVHIKTPKYVIEGDKVRLGEEGASDWLILGSTFRREQKSMDNTLVSQLMTAFAQLTAAGIAVSLAATIPSVPGVPPVALAPAGTALSMAATAIQQAALAIQQFETTGASNDYLSAVSKTK